MAKVIIEDKNGKTTFQGFFLQARDSNDEIIPGEFSTSDISRNVPCGKGKKSALTHVKKEEKSKVSTVWTPPSNFKGVVIFKCTVAQKFTTFWVKLTSNPVTVTNVGIFYSTAKPSVPSIKVSEELYNGCGIDKSCFGLPPKCVEQRECEVVLIYIKSNSSDFIRFELVGSLDSSTGWIAMGLSRNGKMSNSSVTECVTFANQVAIRESWNVDKRRSNILLTGVKNIEDQQIKFVDGIITCHWSRPFSTVVEEQTFDVFHERFYLIMAKGPIDNNGNKNHHSAHTSSSDAVNLTVIELVASKPTYLIKIHGSFMIIAWIGFVSIAILLARFYKDVWQNSKLFGTAVWFSIHRCFMLLSVVLVTTGIITIFIDKGGWSEASNAHPVLGCIVAAFIFIQPLIAALRPHPTHPKRPIFRWIHGIIGNGALLLACVNMFLAYDLNETNLPRSFFWIIAVFVIFFCLIHLFLLLYSRFMASENENSHKPKILQFESEKSKELEKNAPVSTQGNSFKKFVLGAYTVFSIVVTLTLVLIVCLN